MNTLLPTGYLELAGKLDELLPPDRPALMGLEGGSYTYRMTNPLDAPVTVNLAWQGQGWSFSPAAAELTVPAGQTAQRHSRSRAPRRRPRGLSSRPSARCTIPISTATWS